MRNHANRQPLLAVLDRMTEEAFEHVLLGLKEVVERNEANHRFLPASTQSFVDLARAVNTAADEELIDLDPIRQHHPRLFATDPTRA